VARSPKMQKALELAKKATSAANAKVRALSAAKPARIGIAAAGGAIGGALHSWTSLELAGRTIPWSLPAGIVLGAMSKDARAEAMALGMVGHGSGVMITTEAQRMGWAS
jgi:hypothetical protein